MTDENLDRLLTAAKEFDGSDLHLVAGVPPAFRVNGEIIIADEDALTEQDITRMAESLLNEQQQKKFEQEWELCISLLHPNAGRVRGRREKYGRTNLSSAHRPPRPRRARPAYFPFRPLDRQFP